MTTHQSYFGTINSIGWNFPDSEVKNIKTTKAKKKNHGKSKFFG